jgi:hypothetical protein
MLINNYRKITQQFLRNKIKEKQKKKFKDIKLFIKVKKIISSLLKGQFHMDK